jgi:hypothetical protein
MNIRGEAPQDMLCIITLTDTASGKIANTLQVSGTFHERVFLPGTRQAPPMTLTAKCQGKIVAKVENPKLGEVNLGNIKP